MYARAAASRFAVEIVDPAPRSPEAVAEAGIGLHATPGDWLAGVDRVWGCVPGDLALRVFESTAPHLDAGAVYVDLTTASTPAKRAAGALAAERGLGYVDVAIMGAVAMLGVRTPLLVVGDRATETVADLESIGAVARAIDGQVGDAVQLKLLRTVITKGVEALAVDAYAYADRHGLRAGLGEVLSDIAGLTAFLDAVVGTHELHAERRLHEVERALAQLAESDVRSAALEGVRERFAQTATGRAR